MKKALLLISVFLGLLTTSYGQLAPTFYNSNSSTSYNAIPWNPINATYQRSQIIYAPGSFPGSYTGLIDTVWFRSQNPVTSMGAYLNLQISMGQTIGTAATHTSTTFLSGLTPVLNSSAYTTLPSAGTPNWIPIPLTNPFLYNPALSLVIEIRSDGFISPGTGQYMGYTGTASKALFGSNVATTGSISTQYLDAGISLLSPLPCATPTGVTSTAITQTSASIDWTDNNTIAPAGGWDIEYGVSGFTPTGNPSVNTLIKPYPLGGLSQNVSYDVYVRAHCGPGDSSYYSTKYTFTTLASCPIPSNLTATNITSSGALLDWTENGTATQWDVQLVIGGSTPNAVGQFQPTSKPFSVGGLPPLTNLDYYVRSICGPGDTSSWAGPYSFSTPLAPLSCSSGNPGVLFSESFFFTGTSQSNVLPTGWTHTRTLAPWWQMESDLTSSGSTGPPSGHDVLNNGPGYIYLETSGGTLNDNDTLISPLIDLTTAIGNARVLFYTHMYGATMDTMKLYVDNGISTNLVWATGGQQQAQNDPWTLQEVNLGAYAGQLIRLKFNGKRGSSFTGDMGLDEIRVEGCLTCPQPTNLVSSNVTATTADLNWTESGSATQWDIEVVPSASTPTGVPTYDNITVTANNPALNAYTLTGLVTYQAVDIYVRAQCGPTDTSAWLGPITIVPCAPMAGTYTIDPLLAASSTNFQSFQSAAFALNSCGISAPVVINVNNTSSPYAVQLEFGPIVGASMVNTITFNGNNSVVTNAATASPYATLLLNDADYFRFNDLTFEATGSVGFGAQLYNGADHNEFTNCTFQVPLGTSTAQIPFVMSGSLTSGTTNGLANTSDSNKIEGCTMLNGAYSIVARGNTLGNESGNQVINCALNDFYNIGLYEAYQTNFLFSGNDINRTNRPTVTTFYGIYTLSGAGDNNVFSKNWIHNATGTSNTVAYTAYPIYMLQDATSMANANIIENNLIENIENTTGLIYGIYANAANNCIIRHNTVVLDAQNSTTGTTRGIFQTGTASPTDIRNNNIVINRTGTGIKYGLYISAPVANLTSSHNNVYMNPAMTGTNYYGYNAGNQADLTAWQASVPSVGVGCLDLDPIFVNPLLGDYTPANGSLDDQGTPLGVTEDILGATRSATTPDMGAYEFIVVNNDMGATAIISPDTTIGCYSATETISVEIRNYGAVTRDFSVNPCIVNVNVSGTVNQNLQAFVTTGTLAPLATMVVPIPTTLNMTANGPYSMMAYTSAFGDANSTNDSLSAPYNYTVGVTAGTMAVSPDELCFTGSVSGVISGQAGGAIQWQEASSPTGPWSNVGTGLPTYAPVAAVTATTYYRAYSVCNSNSDTTNVAIVNVNAPTVLSTTNDSICGPETGILTAVVGTPSTKVDWYDAPTGGTKLDTGLTFITPVVSVTDTFYAEASDGGLSGLSETVPLNANNGQSGVIFPVTANVGLTIDSIDINIDAGTWNVDIYYMPADYLTIPGAGTNIALWTLLGSTTVTGAGINVPTSIGLPLNLAIPATQTYSFIIANTNGTAMNYTNGTTLGSIWYNSPNLTVYEGNGTVWPLGSLFTPRNFSGVIHYSTGCAASTREPAIVVVNGSISGILSQATASNSASTPGADSITEFHPDGLGRNYYDLTCDIICNVTDAPGGNALGTVQANVTVDAQVTTWQGQPYVRRWYEITPTSQGPADVTLFFTQADFDDYNLHPIVVANAATLALPTGPADAAGIARVNVSKISGGGLGVGTPTSIVPTSVVWNATELRWEVTFPVTTFSQFYVHAVNANASPLPVALTNFTVTKASNTSVAKWITASEVNNSHFNVQRSLDGVNFTTLGRVNSLSPDGNSSTELAYNFTDGAPQLGHNYYRLEQVDINGNKTYSQTVDLMWGANGSVVSIYPNPAKDILHVDIANDKATQIEVRVLDMSGRTVKSVMAKTQVGMNNITVDLAELANGLYGVQVYENNKLTHVDKVRKND